MNIHTPSQHVLVKTSYAVDISAASVIGSSINASGFTKALAVVVAAPSGAGTTSAAKLQESADNVTFADVPGAAFGVIATGSAQTLTMNIDLAKRQKYLRLVHTGSGGSAGGPAAGIIELLNPEQAAVTQDNTAVSV